MPVFPRFEIVRREVEARVSTRSAEVDANVDTERYEVVDCEEVESDEKRFTNVEDAREPTRMPTRDEVGVR